MALCVQSCRTVQRWLQATCCAAVHAAGEVQAEVQNLLLENVQASQVRQQLWK